MSADWHPGIERFCGHWPQAPMLQQTYDTLRRTFAEENDACIDACKGLVECACRVLIENLDDPSNPIRGWKDSPLKSDTPSVNNWVSAAFKLLNMTASRDEPFSSVLSQHFKLVEALGHFRNAAGPISHGKEGFARKLSAHHRRAAVLAAAALVAFLHEAYLEREPSPVSTLEPYERFGRSNELIDHFVTTDAVANGDGGLDVTLSLPNDDTLTLIVAPSRLLFGCDRSAYAYAQDVCRDIVKADPTDEELAS